MPPARIRNAVTTLILALVACSTDQQHRVQHPDEAAHVPQAPAGVAVAPYRLYLYVEGGEPAEAKRNEIIRRAEAEGIRLFSGSCSEIYLEHAYADRDRPDLPVARELGKTSLALECHPTLRPELVERRAERLARIASDVLSA